MSNYSEDLILGMIWILILRYDVNIEIDGVSERRHSSDGASAVQRDMMEST